MKPRKLCQAKQQVDVKFLELEGTIINLTVQTHAKDKEMPVSTASDVINKGVAKVATPGPRGLVRVLYSSLL